MAKNHNMGFFDATYLDYELKKRPCPVSCDSLRKARGRVRGVMRSFGIPSLTGKCVLDVGCGLGYFAEALREQGAKVYAIDSSQIAIKYVRARFPRVDAKVASFPEDFTDDNKFDLIWASDLSLLNTFDHNFIYKAFVRPCLNLLTVHGYLIIGWHSNFSGTWSTSNWAYWSLDIIRSLKEKTGLSGPRIVSVPTITLNNMLIQLSRCLKKSVSIFFCLKVDTE